MSSSTNLDRSLSCTVRVHLTSQDTPMQRMAGLFDGRDSDELSFDELIDGEPEYSRWHARN